MARYVETYRGVVYPWHCDQMGHLNVQHYLGMYDQAACHLFLMVGLTPSHMAAAEVGFADVKQTIEYRGELRMGSLVRMESRISAIGNTSLEHEHRLLNAEDGALAATFEVVSVYFDLAARKAIPFGDEMRAKVRELLA